ncbi:uncharacterized protein FTOL_05862 [Fusarium torulosum]|uniref:Uncharacterized protein n=1 Tax=Fusarium torulosum TaxID=33205 RepID=A0AAE8M843_9HYPO|nr:uncharacterized protein FTOL_05862 [Fusarium torulosum]
MDVEFQGSMSCKYGFCGRVAETVRPASINTSSAAGDGHGQVQQEVVIVGNPADRVHSTLINSEEGPLSEGLDKEAGSEKRKATSKKQKAQTCTLNY